MGIPVQPVSAKKRRSKIGPFFISSLSFSGNQTAIETHVRDRYRSIVYFNVKLNMVYIFICLSKCSLQNTLSTSQMHLSDDFLRQPASRQTRFSCFHHHLRPLQRAYGQILLPEIHGFPLDRQTPAGPSPFSDHTGAMIVSAST